MTKEKLSEYAFLLVEIEGLNKKIKRIEKQSEMVADVVQNGYKRHAVIYGYDLKRKQQFDKLRSILEERRDKALVLCTEIENWISTIDKVEIRQIFEHRYLGGLNWIQIAFIMNSVYKTEKYNEDSVRMKHDRFLKKFSKN